MRACILFTTDPVAVNVNALNDVCVNAILYPDAVPVRWACGLVTCVLCVLCVMSKMTGVLGVSTV